MNDIMSSDMWGKLIKAVKCYAPAKYEIDFLCDPDGQCVVNVILDNEIEDDLETAIYKGYKLGKIVETVLNQYDSSDGTKKWFLYSEENYFKHNGEECDDEWVDECGGIVQHVIIKDWR